MPGLRRIDALLENLPRHLKVLYDADGGVIDYNAFGETIDDITLDAEQSTPFFGRVKRIHGHISGLPSQATVNIKPNAGGFKLDANNPIGSVEAPLMSGPEAGLTTGPLANNELQDLDLDVTFDTPGDAVADPAHIVAFVQDLPATLTLKQQGSKTIYDAFSTVPKVTLDARNLPGGSSGGSLDGGLHNAVGTLTGVPKHFEIAQSPKAGVTADGAFTRADLEAWDHGPQNAAFPEDNRNKVALNTRDGRLHVQARVFALSKVLLGTSLTTSVETAFGSTPAPLDIAVDGGTAGEPLDLDVGVTDLPTSSTFTLSQLLGMKLGWTAATPGTDVTVKLSSKDVGADLTLSDLPSFVDVCVGGGLTGCSPKAPSFFQAGSDLWIFPNAFTAVTNANGTITMGGKVCLPPTDDDGEALSPPGTVYAACLAGASTEPDRDRQPAPQAAAPGVRLRRHDERGRGRRSAGGRAAEAVARGRQRRHPGRQPARAQRHVGLVDDRAGRPQRRPAAGDICIG